MSQAVERPDVDNILAGLKDFQRRTVDYAFRRMYLDDDCNSRFLVADEVGLGKTLVARGLIAKTIDHLWDKRKRIDIVYVCSNSEIARQNLTKLNVCKNCGITQATRLTLLAITLRQLNKQRVNFVSFTPNTSFELSRTGWSRERELLYYLITNEREGVDFKKATRVLEATADTEQFRQRVRAFPDLYETPHPKIAYNFWQRVQQQPDLLNEFDELCKAMPRAGANVPGELRARCNTLIGTLRRMLAEAGLDWLEPDLIILDEFQRFKELLQTGAEEDTSPAADLAQQLFSYRDAQDDPTSAARVLLLSATPYKMYTMHHERQQDDHYADFQATLRFLFDNDELSLSNTASLIENYRRHLLQIADEGPTHIVETKSALERQLRKVMARTERLAASQDRAGMLVERQSMTPALTAADVRAYLHLQQIAEATEQPDMVSYWKSAPYLLNFMDDYDIKRKVSKICEKPDQPPEFVRAFRDGLSGLLSSTDIESYSRIDAGNAQMRAFHHQTIDRGLWKLLWVPASRPYYQPAGAFADAALEDVTKQLVFSCWKVVPKAVAALLSYEAERCMLRTFNRRAQNTAEARKKRRSLLQFSTSRGEPTGMPAFALLYPCRYFSEVGNPFLSVAASNDGRMATAEEALSSAESAIKGELNTITAGGNSEIGDEDHDWYWAAPILLDMRQHRDEILNWLRSPGLHELRSRTSGEDEAEPEGWRKHLERAEQLALGNLQLGRPPADLAAVLARFAVAGPGTAALRALRTNELTAGESSSALHTTAARIGNSLIHLFNLVEVTAFLRDRSKTLPYWRSVLNYCVDGNLQAVLDEYCHVLSDSPGVEVKDSTEDDDKPCDPCHNIAREFEEALELKTGMVQADTFTVRSRKVKLGDPIRIRSRFALAFGDQRSEDGSDGSRKDQVRTAFNSPFWPFVLVTTSVGQEGLDFHRYCHSVVHWNLPSNPVDLEQREGRVHRYKGHALRKNIAYRFGNAIHEPASDLWRTMFREALAARSAGVTDLEPFWITEGPNKIERHVMALPLSREIHQRHNLLRTLAVYRMVFGQSRQEDLVRFLLKNAEKNAISSALQELTISLTPD